MRAISMRTGASPRGAACPRPAGLTAQTPLPLGSLRHGHGRHAPRRMHLSAAAAADAASDEPLPSPGLLSRIPGISHITSLFQVFSDPKANNKLLALAVGQALCSVATLIHDSYLPVYVSEELGLSNTKIGALQGAAQLLAQLSKGVSGVVGDVLGSQVRVVVFGTFLTLLCKPMFVALNSVYGVFGVTACIYTLFAGKLLDRMSKGIREAPTKAIINELARESGDAPDAAYGLRQAMATAGMLLGSTLATLTFVATSGNYQATFAVAGIFPAIALLWLLANFREELGLGTWGAPTTTPEPPPPSISTPPPPSNKASPSDKAAATEGPAPAGGVQLSWLGKGRLLVGAFKPVYWQALVVVALLYMARFDASFLSLRAKQVMDKAALPMLTLINTVLQVVLTAPLARISGRSVASRNRLLLAGFMVMVACDACFAHPATANASGMFLGAGLLGLHMAMTHAITISMVSAYMPVGDLPGLGKISGTAVSFTDLLLGLVLAASNIMAGRLADMTAIAGFGNVGCFVGGAAACLSAALALLLFMRYGDLGKEELVVRRPKKKV